VVGGAAAAGGAEHAGGGAAAVRAPRGPHAAEMQPHRRLPPRRADPL